MEGSRQNHGIPSEDRIEELLRVAFLEDFVVRRPKGIRENGQEEELADFLIPFRDTLVVVQVKSREQGGPGESLSPANLARIERRFDKGVAQLKTIKRALENNWATEIETLRGHKQPFNYGRFKRILGVVVLVLPDEGEFDKETALDLYGGLDEIRGITAHLFLERDLGEILSHISTIPDFVDYLDKREKLMSASILTPFVRELDLLAMFLFQYVRIEQCIAGEATLLHVEEGTWEGLLESKAAELRVLAKRVEMSKALVDGIILRFHESVGYQVPAWARPGDLPGTAGTTEEYFRVIENLASLSRVERILFSESIRKKLLDSMESDFEVTFIDPSPRALPIVYLASSLSRKERSALLRTLVCAYSVCNNCCAVLGIATEDGGAQVRAYDAVAIREGLEFEKEDELREIGDEFLGSGKAISRDVWGNDYDPGTS